MGGIVDRHISTREIEAYFNILKIDDIEDRLDYMNFIAILDQEYLKYKSDHPESPKTDDKGNPKRKK